MTMTSNEGGEIINHHIMSVAMALPPNAIPVVVGYCAFASSLALSTLLQLKVLGVSTGSHRPIPSLVGIASVALSSLASHNTSIKAYEFCRQHQQEVMTQSMTKVSPSVEPPQWQSDMLHFGAIQIDKQTLRICVLGMLSFKLLGGRFWAVAPSSYTHLGSFARFSLPATERYANGSQRAAIERLGRLVGCHTCGSRMFFRKPPRFHGDHMPPKAVAQQINNQWFRKLTGWKVKFRFYPQCVDCSNMQGSILSTASNELRTASFWNKPNLKQAGGGKLARFHGLRFRPFHLVGSVIAAVTVVDATDEDLQQGNRRRYREVEEQVREWSRDAYDFIYNLIGVHE